MSPRQTIAALWCRRLYAFLLLLIGLLLTLGGVWLISLSGSFYYFAAGLLVLASAIFIWRGEALGRWVYGAMLVGTVAWALAEVGFSFWGLAPRLVAPVVLGFGLLIPLIGGANRDSPLRLPRRGGVLLAVGLVAATGLGGALHSRQTPNPDPVFRMGLQAAFPSPDAGVPPNISGDWLHYGNDRGGAKFSPLTQLTPQTVSSLKVAWTADLGPAPAGNPGNLRVTPLKVGDTLYACTPFNTVVALDAETGKRRWTHSEYAGEGAPSAGACRGVAYYHVAGAPPGLCAARILWVSRKGNLMALDAATGRPCVDFGENGRTSLLTGMGDVPTDYYQVTSAPQVVRGKIVIGGWVTDGQYWGEPSGVIRGYDAVTGRFAWAYDVGRPDRRGEPPPGEHYTRSTPNSWAPISADEQLGLVYLPIGNAVPDYYGRQRRTFDEDIASSILAIDAESGERRWRFATVHHDLWDYDIGSQPTLVDLPVEGQVVPALIQATKQGEIFVLDRRTGEPIRPVREMPTPQGPVAPGERLSPTQPYSVAMPSFAGPRLREVDMWGVTPLDQLVCRIQFKQTRYEGVFTPPQLERPTLTAPGNMGGIDTGGVAVDLDRMVMVTNASRIPVRNQLITRAEARKRGVGIVGKDPHANPFATQAMENTPYAAAVRPFLGLLNTPCIAPPWGLITAVDLRTGAVLWNRPLGTARDSGPLGIPSMLPIEIGLPNAGGPIITRGGLVFIAAVTERTFRAIDLRSGREVWTARMPTAGQSTPITYWSDSSDRQFVVIAAGGLAHFQTKSGSTLVAYALPRTRG